MSQPPAAAAYRDYGFTHADASHMHRHFLPPLFAMCEPLGARTRVLDVGCGNGFTVGQFLQRGCREVVGTDLSEKGLALARQNYPDARFELLPADDKLLTNLGCAPFDRVVSTEVVEHLYSPRDFVAGCYQALRPGGWFIVSTPYHGYLKNLVLSLSGKWDAHANPLWDGGHIKLWSRRTLSALLEEAGFVNLRFRGVGRLPFLWMMMLIAAQRPVVGEVDKASP